MFTSGHGCRIIVLLLSTPLSLQALPPEQKDRASIINSRTMEVEYTTQPGTLPLNRVYLWFTTDQGQTWKMHPGESGLRSPIRFLAEDDGLYGFFLVLENEAGTSSDLPQPGQPPIKQVLVDTTTPLLQIRQVRIIDNDWAEQPALVVSWTAYDANLEDRPISLYYQRQKQPGWQSIASNLGNAGRYDWPIPPELSGQIEVKVEAADIAGNLSSDISSAVTVRSRASLASLTKEPSISGKVSNGQVAQSQVATDKPEQIDPERLAKAKELFDLGVWHKERGDYGLAIERLIESLQHNPNLVPPAYELADIYYTERKYQGALDIYQSIISRMPQDRRSLRGSALAWVALRKYPEALSSLEQVLHNSPSDAQTWLDAGDVFVWMGQGEQATRYWDQALKLSPKKAEVRASAQRRLNQLKLKSK